MQPADPDLSALHSALLVAEQHHAEAYANLHTLRANVRAYAKACAQRARNNGADYAEAYANAKQQHKAKLDAAADCTTAAALCVWAAYGAYYSARQRLFHPSPAGEGQGVRAS